MRNKSIRSIVFVLGLFMLALGVSLSVKADLGVTPISCVPYIYSLNIPLTLGELTIILNALFVVMQILILRRKYKLMQLLQLPAVIILGYFIDFTMYLFADMHPSFYFLQFVYLLASCAFIALGVFLMVKARITYIPGDGLMVVIAETFKTDFGKTKICFDSSMVIFGTLSSFAMMGTLVGIREGTFIAAVLVGFLIRLFGKALCKVEAMAARRKHKEYGAGLPEAQANKPFVITISREYGSGGHEIGRNIAKKLGISFYDKELIDLTANKSGFTEDYIKEKEQKIAHTLLYDLYVQNYAYTNDQLPPTDALFLIQSKIIREICSRESCVIVGRCANFILKDNPNCYNIFIHANDQYRISKIINDYKAASSYSAKELEQSDRERANYCLHYTGKNWRDAGNYHVTLDSALYTTDQISQKLIDLVQGTPLHQ